MGRQTYYLLLIQGKEFLKTSMILYLNVFTQLDDFMRGTGLGLPICRLLAEKFGGSLVIDADYTQRCCFVLRLPWVHKEVSDHRLHGFTHI